MTEKTILTPSDFTAESGFLYGVVVEHISAPDYEHETMYFRGVESDRILWSVTPTGTVYPQLLSDIRSVSVLTGPMRFWSGAPGWATHHIYLQADAKSEFFNDSGFGEWKKYGPLRPVTHRPWWCDFGKEA